MPAISDKLREAGHYKKTLIGLSVVLGGLVAYNYVTERKLNTPVIAATPTTPKCKKKVFKKETNTKENPKA
ncbi:hypothetical protein J8273_1725 [Carpediemonas membranifera]|uniref:Uncharacterized protein n=1 Tax=Carpediemonas membranifera TaxID=201153 RepID=A0A8J6BBB1_9EUKA|nr:hypothetical protein J8273_1725 [Carpediemonas membranifera]|eukprot:KAG9396707.1 hypothetical protein J8273_1725 [Carpediemonas membranifera]